MGVEKMGGVVGVTLKVRVESGIEMDVSIKQFTGSRPRIAAC
jgi:hypothetical protein